jgi:hypothetical protein
MHSDVRTLAGLLKGVKVDLITAGFPCQGFSGLGNRKGLQHEQSSLFRHVLDVIDTCRPPLVFLENVQGIVTFTCDFQRIVRSLTSRGYALRWVLADAAFVGALHRRRRWFCVAKKTRGPPEWLSVVGSPSYRAFSWTAAKEPVRMESAAESGFSSSVFAHRWKMLGNSVCPDAARLAFLFLCSGGQVRRVNFTGEFRLRVDDTSDFDRTGVSKGAGHPAYAYVPAAAAGSRAGARGTVGCSLRSPLTVSQAKETTEPNSTQSKMNKLNLVLDPKVYHADPPRLASPLQTTALVVAKEYLGSWATPRASLAAPCNLLTARSMRDLPTQVRFEVNTTGDRSGRVRIQWLEWLMGYPSGWTSTPQWA